MLTDSPTRAGYHLTPEAEDDYADWYGSECNCHRSPPCNSCTHPGNPLNLESDDSAWEPDVSPTAAFDAIKELLG